ncbi:MAG: T9SS type A sorting domain-containing protein [Ferruginibacter sp.]|nr:T9SS type A sorting domain-containing protein [Ferruginibacter sp.]NOU38864.1 T9SS type A sorting domain-containing protein [Ferruginibacter sp.]
MKKIKIFSLLLYCMNVIYAQSVTINYSSPGFGANCNIFAVPITSPPTSPILYQGLEHTTSVGFPSYSSTEKAIKLQEKAITSGSDGCTQYAIKYPFKKNYNYKIMVNCRSIRGTGSLSLPIIKLNLSDDNMGINNSTTCSGPSPFDHALHYATYGAYAVPQTTSFDLSPALINGTLSKNYNYLLVLAAPADLDWSTYPNIISSIFVKSIEITETLPAPPAITFTLTPSPIPLTCGSSTTQIFTANNVNNSPGTITYNWILGAGNGWNYLGSAAPASFTTTTNTITLDSYNSYVSNVQVQPVVNGVAQPTLTAVTSFSYVPYWNYSVSGDASICSGTSNPFVVNGLLPGSVVTWEINTRISSPGNNGGTVVVGNTTTLPNQITLTQVGNGVVDLVAHVTNPCLQTFTLQKNDIYVGNYSTSPTAINGYILAWPQYGYNNGPIYNGINYNPSNYGPPMYSANVVAGLQNNISITSPSLNNATWALITGNVQNLSFYNGGNNFGFTPNDFNPILMRLSQSGGCGVNEFDFWFYPYQYYPPYYYRISPNPTKDNLLVGVNEDKLAKEKIAKSINQDIKEIQIIDKMGIVQTKQTFANGTRLQNINVANLKIGIYTIKIYNGKEWISMQFVKQ